MRQNTLSKISSIVIEPATGIKAPPLPQRTRVDPELTAALADSVLSHRTTARLKCDKPSEISEQLIESLKALIGCSPEDVSINSAADKIQAAATRTFNSFCGDVCSNQSLSDLDSFMRILAKQLEAQTTWSIGDMELAVDSLRRVYIAFPLLRPDGSVRGRMTGPVYDLKCTKP